MCGINGFNFKDEELVQKMNEKLKHRGPDDSGFWVDENVSLGHQRLSIIDLSERGHQPMHSDRYVIVFNGEIYNYREIKKELPDYQFKSDSDTEVILAAYEKWGRDCLAKLNGIFAIAIWDKEKKELLLARDRVGVKPLYYYIGGRRGHESRGDEEADRAGKARGQGGDKIFVFSSEIKAILEHPDVKREVDIEALNHYFRVLYVPAPLTMFKGVRKLEPGHYVLLRNGKVELGNWIKYGHAENKKEGDESKEKYLDEIRALMQNSVRGQLVSDRPLGVFLSGGIDSTSVLGNMSKLGHEKIKTFSVGFDIEDPDNKFNADFNLAKETAKYYGTDHHELLISSKDILENIEDVVWHLDEPICNTTQVATYLLSKMAKEKVAVVLGGDGGDELFGGYERYRLSYLMSRMGVAFKLGRLFGKKLDYPKGIERYSKFMFQEEDEVGRVLRPDIDKKGLTKEFYKNKFEEMRKDPSIRLGAGKEERGEMNSFEQDFMMMDFKTWLTDESLMRTDKMTMAFGLEQRVPILDYRMAELAYTIPTNMKVGMLRNQTKLIWKEAMDEFLPNHIKESAYKKVWLTPMSDWLRGDLNFWAREVLSNEYADTSKYINLDEVRKMFFDHCDKKKYNLYLIWAVITFQIWYKRFILDK